MAIVLLNGDVTGVVHPAGTWGELLEIIDQQRAVAQDVVTVVRLDGVELPAFRSPEALSQTLSANVEVFIETARPADLIEETLDQADTVAKTIGEAARIAARTSPARTRRCPTSATASAHWWW